MIYKNCSLHVVFLANVLSMRTRAAGVTDKSCPPPNTTTTCMADGPRGKQILLYSGQILPLEALFEGDANRWREAMEAWSLE